MQSKLKSYLNILIEDYATKNQGELTLWSDDLPESEQTNLVEYLYEYDDATRDFLMDRMNKLIESRIDANAHSNSRADNDRDRSYDQALYI